MTATRPDSTYKIDGGNLSSQHVQKQTGSKKDNLMTATRPDITYKNKQEGTKTFMVLKK